MGSFAHENKQQNRPPIPGLGQYEIWQRDKGRRAYRRRVGIRYQGYQTMQKVGFNLVLESFVNDTKFSRPFVDACQIGMGKANLLKWYT
jgi:hypothetical protein